MSTTTSAKRIVVITNDAGLHLRPAAVFVQTAKKHGSCEVFVSRDDARVNGKSLMGLVMLQASKGTELLLECVGVGCEAALEELCALVESDFSAG